MLSGVFLGGSEPPPSEPVSRSHKGKWVGEVGHEGYDLAAWNGSSDLVDTPGVSLNMTQGSRYVWTSSTIEERALEAAHGSAREAATYYDSSELSLRLTFKEAYTGELHLYAVDWDSEARREQRSASVRRQPCWMKASTTARGHPSPLSRVAVR